MRRNKPVVDEIGLYPAQSPQLWPVVTPVTIFASGHGYVASGDNAALRDLNHVPTGVGTDTVAKGSQCIKLVTNGDGAQGNARKYAQAPMDFTGKQVAVWVRIGDDPTDTDHVAQVRLYLGDSSLANTYQWNMHGASSGPMVHGGEWFRYTCNFGQAAITGSPTRSAITDIKVAVYDDNTGQPVTAYFNGVETFPEPDHDFFANGVVTICFDDIRDSVYTKARPVMDALGFPGVIYSIDEYIGLSGRISYDQLLALQLAGWDIGAHATTSLAHGMGFPEYAATYGRIALRDELRRAKQSLLDRGFRAGAGDDIAFPLSAQDATTLEECRPLYSSARTTVSRIPETWPPADWMRLRAVSTVGGSGGYAITNLTNANGILDTTKANKAWCILCFHTITDGAAAASSECSIADFTTVMQAISSKGLRVATLTGMKAMMGATA